MTSRGFSVALLFLLAFAVVLALRLPLGWATHWLLPRAVHCEVPEGSLWSGRCGQLSWSGPSGPLALGEVSWTMRPARLLRTRLAFDVSLQRGPAQAAGLVQFGIGRIEVLELHGQGPLDAALSHGIPPGWSGDLEVLGARLRVESGKLTALDGTVMLRNLVNSSRGLVDYGSYRVVFPRAAGAALSVGEVRDEGGPLKVEARLTLTPALAWTLEGRVAARPGADASLIAVLHDSRFLSPPDREGMQPISFSNSL